jgi:carboxylate-amine ligase
MRFDLPTVGVEEEYLLLDRSTGHPTPLAEAVRAAARLQPGLDPDDVQGELLQAQVEVATPVCHDLAAVGGHLLRLRHELSAAAEAHAARLVAVGAAPTHDGAAVVTDEPRYRDIHAGAPGLVDEQLINGMHVHVAVPSRAAGVEVLNRLRCELPLLLALSANSPFWRGRDSGFQSWRAVHFDRWPVQGPPPQFADADDYDHRVETLLATGAIRDRGQLYWDMRVSERYPTVEVRVADVQLRVDEAVLLTGLVRALVITAQRDAAADTRYDVTPFEVLRAASGAAARHGLDGELYDTSRGCLRRAGDALADLLDRVDDALTDAGDDTQVHRLIDRQLREGNGATRQRAVAAREGIAALPPFLEQETIGTWPP